MAPRYFDLRTTVLIVVGHGILPEEEDRPLAYELKQAVNARAEGSEGRVAVVVTDVWLMNNELGEFFPAIAIGGPGVNGFTTQIYGDLPVAFSRDQHVFIQMANEGKRAALWGMDQAGTREAAEVFVRDGLLERFLEQVGIKEVFKKEDYLIMLISGAMHDIDHPGHNNLFEINTESQLSLTYNDKSVLENYHLFVFFNIIANTQLNVFEQLDSNRQKEIRRIFICNVIATDLSNHSSNRQKLSKLFENKANFYDKPDNKNLIMSQILHYADISNPTKPIKIYQKWVDLLFDEYFKQVDR
jgi:hypothetical protein